MKLGFMTNILVTHGMSTLQEIAQWGFDNGFQDLEVGPTVLLDEADYARVIKKGEIQISALTYCRNFLSTDEDEKRQHISELERRIHFASTLGIEKIITSTGIDKTLEEGVYDRADSIRKTPIRSLDAVEQTFSPLLKLAEDKGVKLCFENCPLMGNIAISPVMWSELFSRLSSPNLGLAFDPSHLVWQFVDPYAALEEFAPHILHVHAKDTEIDHTQLARCGILTDFSWWKYRIPGGGELDWKRMVNLLKQHSYKGTISLEHEDSSYEENLSAVQEGLILARKHVAQFI